MKLPKRIFNKIKRTIWDNSLPDRKLLINKMIPPRHLNIGGGNFFEKGWINLDELKIKGVTYTKLSSHVVFPIKDNQIEVAYNSHNLEHLDDGTVERVITECYRTLRPSGHFIIKVPDYDRLALEYHKGNDQYFENLGYDSVLWSWPSFNVKDDIASRWSMLVCGYWNKAYGDHFSGNITRSPEAYHGPALLQGAELRKLLDTMNIRLISKSLNEIALSDPNFGCFNHQNAWSRKDLEKLLESHGFTTLKMSYKEIKAKFKFDDLERMSSWSMFVVAQKPTTK